MESEARLVRDEKRPRRFATRSSCLPAAVPVGAGSKRGLWRNRDGCCPRSSLTLTTRQPGSRADKGWKRRVVLPRFYLFIFLSLRITDKRGVPLPASRANTRLNTQSPPSLPPGSTNEHQAFSTAKI
ncbi:hypothetical protein MATL_G00248110 [Megalops atlanticus]|uniref:Uncharacterized protein n=1 Tax=Megalops atlanticus TaxID=7932 RepID=A0A9D3PER5_MEGAT|nr:hypothetical protein MATL_G00248110 [Megalops atlanticus]